MCSIPIESRKMKIRSFLYCTSILSCFLLLSLFISCRNVLPLQKAESRATAPEKIEPEGFLEAAASGDLDGVRSLMAEDPGLLELEDAAGWDALSYAAWGAHDQVYQHLLRQGAEGNLFTEAALGPWESFLQRLETNPIGVQARDPKHKAIPLIWAVRTGNQAGCEVLLSRGSDVAASDRQGNTALHHAVLMGQTDLLGLLLYAGVFIDAANDHGQTALHMATADGDYEVCQLLLDRGAFIGASDRKGNTPLHIAAGQGNFELCEYFLFYGAQAAQQNREGLTPRELAQNQGHDRVAELLGAKLR